MFEGCSSLIELNWEHLNLKKLNNKANMMGMFTKCSDDFRKKLKNKFKNLKNEAFVEPIFKKFK